MKVAVVGSRGFVNKALLYKVLDNLKEKEPALDKIEVIVSGGAVGADQLAETYAREREIEMDIYLPEYERFGRGAPLKRNIKIFEAAYLVVAFLDGKITGTKHSINVATKKKKKVVIISVNKSEIS